MLQSLFNECYAPKRMTLYHTFDSWQDIGQFSMGKYCTTLPFQHSLPNVTQKCASGSVVVCIDVQANTPGIITIGDISLINNTNVFVPSSRHCMDNVYIVVGALSSEQARTSGEHQRDADENDKTSSIRHDTTKRPLSYPPNLGVSSHNNLNPVPPAFSSKSTKRTPVSDEPQRPPSYPPNLEVSNNNLNPALPASSEPTKQAHTPVSDEPQRPPPHSPNLGESSTNTPTPAPSALPAPSAPLEPLKAGTHSNSNETGNADPPPEYSQSAQQPKLLAPGDEKIIAQIKQCWVTIPRLIQKRILQVENAQSV
tara:strand:- start:17406 stop:18338 length:933 start_codon:yes stop_codon:yes gene_type:complete